MATQDINNIRDTVGEDNKNTSKNESLNQVEKNKEADINKAFQSSVLIKDKLKLNEIFGVNLNPYAVNYNDNTPVDVEIPRGSEDFENDVKEGDKRLSNLNRLHVIKLNGIPADEKDINSSTYIKNYMPKTAVDLCLTAKGMVMYDIEDFLYCKWLGVPINRMITLRRFAAPCIDNIFTLKRKNKHTKDDEKTNDVGDIARMVTYMTAETNKIDDILSLSYALKWKQLTSDMEQVSSFGEQSGLSGWSKNIGKMFDKTTNSNYLSGRSTGGPMSSYDPKFDQNRVYGPVDSIAETHIRDVGLEFTKEFEITFDYELRSINGRTPEYAMKDIIANVLACTFNNGKFWPGSRYWVGERPSPWARKLQWMNSGNIDTVMSGMMGTLSNILKQFGSGESRLGLLKQAIKGGFAIAMGKLLDGIGRPGIPAMNSLLSSAPVGHWHLMVGNPHNPVLSIGNLICTGTDIKFPTDTFGFGDFPTKLQVIVKLKPGMPKDKAQVESIFNRGMGKMYWQPTKQQIHKNSTNKNLGLIRKGKLVNGELTDIDIARQVQQAWDFIPKNNSGTDLISPTLLFEDKDTVVDNIYYDNFNADNFDKATDMETSDFEARKKKIEEDKKRMGLNDK